MIPDEVRSCTDAESAYCVLSNSLVCMSKSGCGPWSRRRWIRTYLYIPEMCGNEVGSLTELKGHDLMHTEVSI